MIFLITFYYLNTLHYSYSSRINHLFQFFSQDAPQFAVGLDPRRKTVEFSIPKYDRSIQTVTWDVPQVFTDEWHKIHFGVFRDKVVLYVNCQPVRDCSIYFKHLRAIVFLIFIQHHQ